MNREIATEDRAEAHKDMDDDETMRSIKYVPRIEKERFDTWVGMSMESDINDLGMTEQGVLATKALSDFVRDISPGHLPPNMRKKRETLLRRLWGDDE